jgi:hypothetical protein
VGEPPDIDYVATRLSEYEAIPGVLLDADGSKAKVIVRVFAFPGEGGAVRVVIQDKDKDVDQQLYVNADKLRARLDSPSIPGDDPQP